MRRVLRVLGSGPSAGALTMLALFVLDRLTGEVGFLGRPDARAMDLVMQHARSAALRRQLLILSTLVVAGTIFGALGALAGRAWDWALGRTPPKISAWRGIAGALVFHGYFLSRSIIVYPQLYSTLLYSKGGVRAATMVFLTDHVSLRALNVLFAIVCIVAFVVPVVVRRREAMAWLRAHPRRAIGLGAIVVVVVGIFALGRVRSHRSSSSSSSSSSSRPNLLFIAVDSLRADRVFSPDAATRFPTLARLARDGVRFQSAYVSQARTFPSFVTLLTGRFPTHHGIRHEFPTAEARRAIGPSITSAMHDAGWKTAAVSDFSGEIFARAPLGLEDVDVAHFNLFTIVEGSILESHLHVLPYAATSLGERVFPSLRAMAEYADPESLVDRANTALDAAGTDPFCLIVFFSGTHTPYVAPSPYYEEFAAPGYRGPYKYLKEPLPLLPSLPQEDAKQVQALYDGSLAAVDAALARLLRRLEEHGRSRNTIVVLFGDHGENLFDLPGRGLGHGDHLLGDLANHIPIVVVDPTHAFSPHDVRGIVRDVDLAPTLAGLVGVAPPPTDGVDLAPMLRSEKDALDLHAFEETGLWFVRNGPGFSAHERRPYPDVWQATQVDADGDISIQPKWEQPIVTSKHRAVRTPQWKLLYQPTLNGPRWRLFDVVADPEQRDDVAAAHADEVSALRAELEKWITSDGLSQVQPDAHPP